MQIVYLDPSKLDPNDRNPRQEVGDVADLVASMQVLGVLQPLIVIPGGAPDRFTIVAGHRRQAAAIEVGLEAVPCVLAEDEDAAGQVVTMLAENLHRQDLTATEEARGYEQLALLDWEPERIAGVTGRSRQHVTDALALRKLPSAVQQAADAGQVDLANAATLEEFRDDPKVMQRIIDRGAKSPWGFKHVIAEERHKRERKTAAERLRAELVLAGVNVTPMPKGWPFQGKAAAAHELADADGNPFDPEQVKTEPGFKVFIDTGQGTSKPVVYCPDPEAWGFTRLRGGAAVEDAQDRADRQAAETARREALEVAAGVRREFCRQYYGTVKHRKPLYPVVLRVAATDPDALRVRGTMVEFAGKLAGGAIDDVPAAASHDRMMRVLVARWIAGGEADLEAARVHSWGLDAQAALDYLARLTTDGYSLSEAEQQLRDDLQAELAEEQADDEEAERDAIESDDERPASDTEPGDLPNDDESAPGESDTALVDDQYETAEAVSA